MSRRKLEHGQTLRDVRLQPSTELRRRLEIFVHGQPQPPVRFGPVRRIEDGAQVAREFAAQSHARHIMTRVLLQMKLAALPRHARKPSLPRGLQPSMIIADNQFYSMQPARLSPREKVAPVYFRFA